VKNQTLVCLTYVFFCIMSLTSCATANTTATEAGFFSGIIHGVVLFPFALLAELFGMGYNLYAAHNCGFYYWIGYVIGLGGLATAGRAALSE
jgi:hypothetical protein